MVLNIYTSYLQTRQQQQQHCECEVQHQTPHSSTKDHQVLSRVHHWVFCKEPLCCPLCRLQEVCHFLTVFSPIITFSSSNTFLLLFLLASFKVRSWLCSCNGRYRRHSSQWVVSLQKARFTFGPFSGNCMQDQYVIFTPHLYIIFLTTFQAKGIGAIHAAGVIHKNINPANIVYCESTGELNIIDFGISSQLSKNEVISLSTLITLSHSSPLRLSYHFSTTLAKKITPIAHSIHLCRFHPHRYHSETKTWTKHMTRGWKWRGRSCTSHQNRLEGWIESLTTALTSTLLVRHTPLFWLFPFFSPLSLLILLLQSYFSFINIYLGVTFYELLSGVPPFTQSGAHAYIDLVYKHLAVHPRSILEVPPSPAQHSALHSWWLCLLVSIFTKIF